MEIPYKTDSEFRESILEMVSAKKSHIFIQSPDFIVKPPLQAEQLSTPPDPNTILKHINNTVSV